MIFATAGLYVIYCYIHNMPLLSSDLPAYTGEYDVGTIDIEVPVERRRINDAIRIETGEPAFQLETVFFSLFYPAVKGSKSKAAKHLWVPKPVSLQAEGYARFAHVNNRLTNNVFTLGLWSLAGSTTVPAEVDVPLHGTRETAYDSSYQAETPLDDYGLPEFPVIVFSHGMASSRTSYTQYCAELASRGYVVTAVEHRDGSCPGSILKYKNGTEKMVFHLNEASLDPKPERQQLKEMQLAMRQAEVEETVRALRLINGGDGRRLHEANSRGEGIVLPEWKGRLNMKRVVVGGHSYGATLALQALKNAPCPERPFVGGLILDPGKHSGPLNDDIKVPILVVHSQSWSSQHSMFQGRPHFDVVKDLAQGVLNRKKYAWFLTCKGTTHPSVTDAPLIEPFLLSWTTGATIDVKEGIMQYVKISHEFMQYLGDGHRRGILTEEVSHPKYDEERRKIEKDNVAKFWQVHVAPSTFCPYPGLCGVEPDG